MKKSLYTSIVVGAVILGLGMQLNNQLTVHAETTIETEDVGNDVVVSDTTEESENSQTDISEKDDIKPDDIKSEEPEVEIPTAPVKSDSGWTERNDLDSDSVVRTGQLTDDVYSKWGELAGRPQTAKTEKMLELVKQAADFLNPDNGLHYGSRAEVEDFFSKFYADYANLETYTDDGKLVVKITHHSNGRRDIAKAIDLNIVTIKQARLFTRDGQEITDRNLSNNSSWHVDMIKIINGQKMYRVSDTEWVAIDDVK